MKQSPASAAPALLCRPVLCSVVTPIGGLNTHDLANLRAPIFTADKRKAVDVKLAAISNRVRYNYADKQETPHNYLPDELP